MGSCEHISGTSGSIKYGAEQLLVSEEDICFVQSIYVERIMQHCYSDVTGSTALSVTRLSSIAKTHNNMTTRTASRYGINWSIAGTA
jgi:hypothetical protein